MRSALLLQFVRWPPQERTVSITVSTVGERFNRSLVPDCTRLLIRLSPGHIRRFLEEEDPSEESSATCKLALIGSSLLHATFPVEFTLFCHQMILFHDIILNKPGVKAPPRIIVQDGRMKRKRNVIHIIRFLSFHLI